MTRNYDQNTREIDEYLARFKNVSPSERLAYMGQLKRFFLENMTAKGREFFEKTRREPELDNSE